MLVANARMYAVDAAVETHWRQLLRWVGEHARVALDYVAHPAPAPLADLWRRDDLGAATMCGYPLASWRGDARPAPLAAPCPRFAAGRPVYWTDIVVRADSRFASDDELAGTRFGWTIEDSQSGYQAPRRHFAARALARDGKFFAATIGPLVTPRRVVDAIVAGTIDAGPLDAYWHALLRRHEPALASRLRIVATTEPAPIPGFVAAAATPPAARAELTAAFVDVGHAQALAATLDALELDGFASVEPSAYDALVAQAREVDALGYSQLR
jgi:ABC-type phosphate/phosphonate transport system substrate-binding protein